MFWLGLCRYLVGGFRVLGLLLFQLWLFLLGLLRFWLELLLLLFLYLWLQRFWLGLLLLDFLYLRLLILLRRLDGLCLLRLLRLLSCLWLDCLDSGWLRLLLSLVSS